MTLRVVAPGALTLIQDGGRGAVAHLGLGRGGAADRAALAAANRAVGNPPGAAGLETVLDGLTLEALAPSLVAIAGSGQPVTPVALEPGQRVTVEAGPLGLRRYVAVRGGVDVPDSLGGRGTDTLAGLGPPPVRGGDVLRVGGSADALPETVADPPLDGPVRVQPGPHHDWFDFAQLVATDWMASASADRTAVRLEATPLVRRVEGEVAPIGILPGAIQVPPSGQPLVFLYDHPATGGYPIIGVVDPDDLRFVAQARPGHAVGLTTP